MDQSEESGEDLKQNPGFIDDLFPSWFVLELQVRPLITNRVLLLKTNQQI